MILHIAVLLLLIALAPLVALIPVRLFATSSVRSRGVGQRARMAKLDGEGSLTVKGVLRVEGPIEEAGGAPLGAVTIWSSARRFAFERPKFEGHKRAEKLMLVADTQRYELRGPVDVMSGSHTIFTGARAEAIDRKAFAIRTYLFDGDEVTVAGVATSATEGKEYRDRGATVIEPTADAGSIRICANNPPKTIVPAGGLLRHFLVIPLMLFGAVPLYTFISDYSKTDCAETCSGYGWCSTVSSFQARDFWDALKGLRRGEHVVCAPTSDAHCQASRFCGELGLCTAAAGECIATTAEDCRRTPGCLSSGSCSPSDGRCSALTADDCIYTERCVEDGLCTPQHGFCRVATAERCRETRDCMDHGSCGVRDDTCAATENAHCAAISYCESLGHCTAVDGRCALTSDADCRQTSGCRERGTCSFVEGRCVARTANDCRDSDDCAERGRCLPKEGVCVPDAATCRDSLACKHWGRCEGEGFCRANEKDTAGCEKAAVCQGKTNCRPLAGVCATSCQETEMCKRHGWCTQRGQQECIVGSAADCAATTRCTEYGACSVREGSCSLTSDEDCAGTNRCKTLGACTLVKESCVRTEAACESTPACKLLGKCKVKGFDCVVGDGSCSGSEVCAKFGWCTPVRGYSSKDECGPPGMVKAR